MSDAVNKQRVIYIINAILFVAIVIITGALFVSSKHDRYVNLAAMGWLMILNSTLVGLNLLAALVLFISSRSLVDEALARRKAMMKACLLSALLACVIGLPFCLSVPSWPR